MTFCLSTINFEDLKFGCEKSDLLLFYDQFRGSPSLDAKRVDFYELFRNPVNPQVDSKSTNKFVVFSKFYLFSKTNKVMLKFYTDFKSVAKAVR